MTSPTAVPVSPWLPRVIRLTAAGFLLFFSVAFAGVLLNVDLGPRLMCLVRWGQNGRAYELMICSIYIVWGLFLWRSARDPLANKLFLDFTIAANVAHFGTMFFAALLIPSEHPHLVGDVLLGWLSLCLLMAFWLPARGREQAA